jgi:signal transduction histidine kinase
VARRQRTGASLRGPQFLLDDRAARHIEGFLNQARLVLVGCLMLLANAHLLPDSSPQLPVALAVGGVGWVVTVALLTHYAYRPWVAIAIALGDTVFVSLLVYLTGGPASPLEGLYPILIFAAAVRLTRIHSFLLTLAVILAYLEVGWIHPSFGLFANTFATRAVILAATGVLASLIADEVARQRQLVVEAEGRVASLTLIDHVTRTLNAAAEIEDVLEAAVSLAAELLGGCAIAVLPSTGRVRARVKARGVTWPDRPPGLAGDPRVDVVRVMRAQGCAEVLAAAVGPPEQPRAWLYVGTRNADAVTPADRAVLQRIAEETGNALQRTGLLQRERERAASLAVLADENRRLLEGERETVARLRQLAAHKDGFIDLVAHELRTPLTSVKGFAQLLLRGPTTDASRRYVELILGESNRLVRIIDDIVDLSRMERGLLEMQSEPLDLRRVLADVEQTLAATAYRVRVELVDEPLPVWGDRDKLRQAVLNLVSAGATYHQGAEPMRLRALADGEHTVVALDVAGRMPVHELGRVFDRRPSGTHGEPTSLSLYICKNFVEAHHGQLRVERPGPDASRVVLSLPADRAADRVLNRSRARPTAHRRFQSGGPAHG